MLAVKPIGREGRGDFMLTCVEDVFDLAHMGEVIAHDFGDASAYEPSDSLRNLAEAQKRKELGGSFAESTSGLFESWAAELENGGDTRTVIDQLRQFAPRLREILATLEARNPTEEAVSYLKQQREIFKLRALIYRELVHDEVKAGKCTRMVEKLDAEIASVGDLTAVSDEK